MYTTINYKTKKALKEAVARGERVTIFQPGGFFNPPEAQANFSGKATLEGPHYPAPHSWYATATLVNGIVVKVS